MSILVHLLLVFVAPSLSLGSDTGAMRGEAEAAIVVGDCPAPQADSGTRIRNLLTTPLLPELRARFDFGTASADDIQLLSNERDSETCRALWQAVRTGGTTLSPGDHLSFYRSGDRFFVPIHREGPPAPGVVIRLDGASSVDVYDAEYRLVGRFQA
jgi:hypothetical protein